MIFYIFLVDAKLMENSILLLLFVEVVVLTKMLPLNIRYSKLLCTYIKKGQCTYFVHVVLQNNCGTTEVGYG